MSDTANETAAPRLTRREQTSTVTVGCSLANGLLMQLYDIEEVETTLPNGKTVRENHATLNLDAGQYRLNGASIDYAALAAGSLPDYRVIKGSAPGTGYGLTTGIPREFAEEWFRQNRESPLVKPRQGTTPYVFMASSEARAVDQAREMKDHRSGFQGLNQAGDYRVPSGRGIRKYNPSDNRVSPEQSELVNAE